MQEFEHIQRRTGISLLDVREKMAGQRAGIGCHQTGINKTMKKSDIIAIVLLNNALTEVTAERDKFMKAFIAASRDLQKAQKEIKQLKNQACDLNKVNV